MISSNNDFDFLEVQDLIEIGSQLISDFRIRDLGLLVSAAARPRTTVFGADAYPTFGEKAAALMHSLGRNHALIDGNKRIAWSATRVFCLLNGFDITLSADAAYEIVIDVATGVLNIQGLAIALNIAKIN